MNITAFPPIILKNIKRNHALFKLNEENLDDIIETYYQKLKEIKEKIILFMRNLNIEQKAKEEEKVYNLNYIFNLYDELLKAFINETLSDIYHTPSNIEALSNFIKHIFESFRLQYYYHYSNSLIHLTKEISEFIEYKLNLCKSNIQLCIDNIIPVYDFITTYQEQENFTESYKTDLTKYLLNFYHFKLRIIEKEEEIKFYLQTYRKLIKSSEVLSLEQMKRNTDALKRFKINIGLLDESPDRTDEMIEKMAELFIFYEQGQFNILKSNLDILIDTIQKLLFPSSITGGNFKRKAVRKLLKKYK